MRILSGACLLILVAVFAHADEFTPAEVRQVQETAAQLQAACAGELQKLIDSEKDGGPTSGVMDYLSPRYCTCLSESAAQRLSPDLLRTGQERDFQNFFGTLAQDCAVAEFKVSFPKICLGWFGQAPNLDAKRAEELGRKVNDACACMQSDVNSLQGNQLSEVTRDTLQDYSDYQRDPKNFKSTRGNSLFPSWQACAEATR